MFPVAASEIGGSFSMGNNNLPKEIATDTAFAGDKFPWGMNLYWENEASDVSGIAVGFYRDPLLQNLGYANFYYNEDYFNIKVGPFFGLFNTKETLIQSGISTSIRVNIPGIAFAQFDTQSTIGGRIAEIGDYTQEANNISIGFYVYNAICTIMIDTENYTLMNEAGNTQSDNLTEYSFNTDLFQKNVPYNVSLKIAYQNRVRTIETISVFSLNSVVLGTDLTISPWDFLSFFIGMESSLYVFGSLENLTVTPTTKELLTFSTEPPGNFLFNASLGVTVNLDNIDN